ncbi:hypothetical protein GCM10027078_04320 [Nocardioides flavus (ex Wang et al. 2016)]
MVLAVGACSDPEEPAGGTSVDPGEVVGLDRPVQVDDLDPEPALTAQVPSGVVRIAWRAADEVEGARQQAGDLDAPDGTQLVVVAWELDVTAVDSPGVSALAALGTDADIEVVLSSGEATVALATDDIPLAGSGLVALPDPDELTAEVTFDGVAQTVGPGDDERDVPDQVAPLYDGVPAATASLDCAPTRLRAICRADAAWLPWTDEGGWAPAGRLWPVVRAEGSARGASGSATATVTLDGTAAVTSLQQGAVDGGFNGLHVFPAVEPSRARLDLEVTLGGDRLTGVGVLVPERATPSPTAG